MAQLAPLLLSLIILFGYAVAGFLALYALLPGRVGARWGGVSLVPAAAALVLLAILLTVFREPSTDLVFRLVRGGLTAGPWQLSPWTARAVVGLTVLAALIAVFLAAHLIPHAVAQWKVWRERTGTGVVDGSRVVLVGVLILAIVGSAGATGRFVAEGHQESASGRIAFTHPLPGTPTGITLGEGAGYITFGEGQIARVKLSADGAELDLEVVADGLTFPRGPQIVGDELLVVDLGQLGCAEPFPQCHTADPPEELRRINASSGRILGFEIGDGGELGEPREVVGGLPVVNSSHAPSSLSLGPDGYVYLTIGGTDYLQRSPELLNDIRHEQADLLGTLVRFRPDDAQVEVIASGLRNVFDITFDAEGRMLGVDNDGETVRGWHHEQLIEIVPERDYGYPLSGSFDEGVPPPLWVVQATASAGIAWTDATDPPGILTGSYGEVLFIPLVADDQGLYVPSRQQVREVVDGISGFVTAIAPLTSDRYALTIFDPGGAANSLLILDLTPTGA